MQKLRIQTNRKFWIIVASVVVAIIVVAGLAFWLLRSVEASAAAGISKTNADVSSSLQILNDKLSKKEITPKQRLEAFSGFNQSVVKLNGDLCKEDSKNIMFAISKANERCKVAHEKILSVGTAAEKLEMKIKDDQSLAETMQNIKDFEGTDSSKLLTLWTDFASRLPSVTVSSESTAIKNQLLAIAVTYRTALQELADADKAQNKASFNAAIAKVNTAHSELSKAIETQESGFKKIATELKQAILNLEK